MKILVISLAGIGDTLIATPLIHELALGFPGATIDALVFWPGSRDLLEGNPWLRHVHQQILFQLGYVGAARYLMAFRQERYDISINTHPQSKVHYRFAAWLVGAKRRLSHVYDNFTVLDHLLVNRTLPQDYAVHSVDNNLRLLRLLDRQPALPEHGFELFLSEQETGTARTLAERHRLQDGRVVGIHVGSGKTKNLELKRWPLPHWIELIRQIEQRLPEVTVLLFGGPEEKEDNAQILREISGSRVVAPATRSLREAAALLRHCEAFISVDNALMHFAAAMKVPQQILIESPTFGPTLAPYRRPYHLVANPAVHGRNLDYYRYDGRGIRGSRVHLLECMRAVKPEDVLATLARALNLPAR